MSNSEHPQRRRGFFASRAFVIVGLIITGFILFANIRAFYKDRAIKQEIATLEYQRQQLTQKKLESMEILQYVRSKEFVEEKARTELNMKKPGEHVAIVKTNDTQLTKEVAPSNKWTGQTLKNPIKWWYYFSHQSYDQPTGTDS